MRTVMAIIFGLAACGGEARDELEESKKELARLLVKKHALEYYPLWVLRPNNTGSCPTAAQLAQFGGDAKDPWGSELVIACEPLPPGAVGIAISSPGPDRKAGTADDVRSWDRVSGP